MVLDPAETVRAGREIGKRARSPRKQALMMAGYFAPIVLVLVGGLPFSVLTPYLVILAALGLFTLVWPAIRTWQIRKVYRTTPALKGVQRYEFADDGLVLSNDGARNLILWSAFIEAAETADFFLFYYSPKCAYYLPRHVVARENKEDDLRAFLRSKLGARAEHIPAQP